MKEIVPLNECINYIISRANMSVNQVFRTMLEPYDLTPAQAGILEALFENDGQGLKAIGERMGYNGSTLTGVIDRLEGKQLVRRKADKTDRRAFLIFLTKKGKDLETELTEVITTANNHVMSTIDKESTDSLKFMLRKLIETTPPST